MTLMNTYSRSYLQAKINNYSAEALSDRELFMYLLNQQFPINKSQRLVDNFFKEYGDLGHLEYFNLNNWAEFLGDQSKAEVFAAVCEFARRYRVKRHLNMGQVYSSREIGEFLSKELDAEKQERLILIVLDTKNQVLAIKTVFKGTLNTSLVHPREIFNIALRYSAARFIVAHNHPSGNVNPSKNDLEMTKRLQKAGQIVGIELLDHIIVGNCNYLSMREERIIN